MEYYGPHIFQVGFSGDNITLLTPLVQSSTENVNSVSWWIWRVWQHSLYPCFAPCSSFHLCSLLPLKCLMYGLGVELEKKICWGASNDSICFQFFAFTWCFSRICWGALASGPVYALHSVHFSICALLEMAGPIKSNWIPCCTFKLSSWMQCRV